MNRKFLILGLCALIAVAAMFVFASGSGRKRSAAANQSVVITPDGKLTVAPPQDAWTVTMEKPQTKTNTSSALTNSDSK